jgi:hypothetical protein
MNNFKIKDPNLARLINSFISSKIFSYNVIYNIDNTSVIIYYKNKSYFVIELYNDFISPSIYFFEYSNSIAREIKICPKSVRYLDGLGLNKAHKELCKLLNVKIELSDDENCVLKLSQERIAKAKDDFSLKEKKKVGCKMKPYYLAFKDISFKGVKSKVKSNGALIKKYFVIQRIGNYMCLEFLKIRNGLEKLSTTNRNFFYESINRILKDECNNLVPVSEWKVTPEKIQVEPSENIAKWIEDASNTGLGKSPFRFKHSNPRITNKKQLQNYVSEYNNDKGFYEYLSASSNTQS